MHRFSTVFILACLLCLYVASGKAKAESGGFVDPLDVAAVVTTQLASQPFIAIAPAGDHLVAVGPRGVIAYSGPNGQDWQQAAVPVQSDLVAVQFTDAKNGWAVGHDSVILHTQDGGRSWTKELDGRSARSIFENIYNKDIASGNAPVSADLQEIQSNFDPGPILPWLGVWFTDNQTGYAVGPFGDIAKTTDGGENWIPWLDHIDNPNFYDLNAIGAVGTQLYIVGEQGTVFYFDPSQQKFVARPTSYSGSLFGVTGDDHTLIVFGLRGNIFRSTDQGKTWTQSKNPSQSSIMSGIRTRDGQYVLVTADGFVLRSTDDGLSFQLVGRWNQNVPLTGLAESQQGLVLTSL